VAGCSGIGGRIKSEWVAGYFRNQWPDDPGIRSLRRAAIPATDRAVSSDVLDGIPEHYYFVPDLHDRRISTLTLRALRHVDIPAEIAAQFSRYGRYLDRLQAIPGVAPLFPDLLPGSVPMGMPVLVAAAQRNGLAEALQAEGIEATPWWRGQHRRLDYTGQAGALDLKARVLFLPTHQGVRPDEVDHIAALLHALLFRG